MTAVVKTFFVFIVLIVLFKIKSNDERLVLKVNRVDLVPRPSDFREYFKLRETDSRIDQSLR